MICQRQIESLRGFPGKEAKPKPRCSDVKVGRGSGATQRQMRWTLAGRSRADLVLRHSQNVGCAVLANR